MESSSFSSVSSKAVFLLAACVAYLNPAIVVAQGDAELPDGTVVDPNGMAYNTDELLDEIGNIWGQEARTTAASGLNGAIVGELPDSDKRLGDHDAGTIGVQTKIGGKAVSKAKAAGRLKHEARHRKNAKDKGKEKDPDTRGLCGECAHASFHFGDVIDVNLEHCESMTWSDPLGLYNLCQAMAENLEAGAYWLGRCGIHCGGGTVEAETKQKQDEARNRYQQCCH